MSRAIRLTSAAAAAVAIGLIGASGASAGTIRGTVVHRNAHAHSFTIAGRHGHLSAVHAARSPGMGRVVRVRARALRNGTFKALRIRRGAVRHRAKVRGTVTYRSRSRRLFVVSARGVSLVVHQRHARVRGAAAGLPPVGEDVTVDVDLDDQGDIDAEHVDDHGQDNGNVEVEGIVGAVDPGSRTLTLSADDDGESGGTLTVILPAGFDPAAYNVGDEVEFVATLNPDGTFTAVASSGEDNAQEADDSSDDQGDQTENDQGQDPADSGSDDPGD